MRDYFEEFGEFMINFWPSFLGDALFSPVCLWSVPCTMHMESTESIEWAIMDSITSSVFQTEGAIRLMLQRTCLYV